MKLKVIRSGKICFATLCIYDWYGFWSISGVINLRFLDVQTEINYLGQLQHPNLVKLIGYCLEDEHRLLVYEFMPKGSMENHLFRSEFLASSIVANDNHF